MKKYLELILKKLAGAALKRYHPLVVGVTGSMGKTSTREAIYAVLGAKFNTRRNIKNYNNEIGVPLTILGLESGGRSLASWMGNFKKALETVFLIQEYPEMLVLEMGADKPGDIRYLMSFVDLNAGVITGIGDIPVHVEFFGTSAQVAREKARLIEFLKSDDFAVLNFDDERVKKLASKTRAKILSYGFCQEAGVRAVNYQPNIGLDIENSGINFKIEHEGKTALVRRRGVFGRHQVYPILAASAVGLGFGMKLPEIAEALKNYKPPKGRMNLLAGIKQTWILDDSYNASPPAAAEALETLGQFEGRRRIAVLGDMLELGHFTEQAHRQIGEKAKESADLFFAVGDRMKFAAESAQKKGMKKQKIFCFEDADAARLPLQMTIRKGDVILIKGSQSMRLEKIVEEIMAYPEKAGELLVRQEEKWKKEF
jgi:UDP-N-acetylmuramoyl-tripeptide--D-alanyl-D-alanine ligase